MNMTLQSSGSRPAGGVVLAAEVDRVHPGVVHLDPPLAVQHEGVGRLWDSWEPDEVDELVGPFVPLVVRRQGVEPVVLRRAVLAGGDDVPADAPVGDVVQRREPAGQQPRRVEGRRGRRDDPDA
jgi:hypothetical protein